MRRKLILSNLILILFVAGVVGYYSIHVSQKYFISELMEEMEIQCELIGDVLSTEREQSLTSLCDEYDRKTGLRITLINKRGVVLADSRADVSALGNHAGRPEIVAALTSGSGRAERYSETEGGNYLFVARTQQLDGQPMILRVGRETLAVEDVRKDVVNRSTYGVFLAVIIAGVVAWYVFGRITAPIHKLTDAVNDVAKGNYGKRIPVTEDGDVGELMRAFNDMSRELSYSVMQFKDRNSKLQAVIDGVNSGVLMLDQRGQVILTNLFLRELFNLEEAKITRAEFGLMDVSRNEALYDAVSRAQAEEGVHIAEYMAEDGKIIKAYARSVMIHEEFLEERGELIVFEDITQTRKLEQMRSDFVANVTHELKTPLTSIMGFVDTLKSGAIDEPQVAKRFLDVIDVEAERLNRLIFDVLALSEIETREADENETPEDVAAIAEEALELLSARAEDKGLYLELDAEAGIPLFTCNRDRILQILLNLAGNGISHTEKGGVRVTVEREGETLVLAVADTGVGIAPEHHDRIFERFYRADKGRSRRMGGTGLGLAIVKHIVQLYHGTVGVESKVGEGTTFTVRLPYQTRGGR